MENGSARPEDGIGDHGFLEINAIFTAIDDPDATDGTYPMGINDAGQIVGYFYNGAGNTDRNGFLDTNGVFTTIDFPGSSSDGSIAYGINDAGQIVGETDTNGEIIGFLGTPETTATPEPSMFVLLMMGAVGLF